MGLAELEALFGAQKVRMAGRDSALLDVPMDAIHHQILGGTIKICEVIATTTLQRWNELENYCLQQLPNKLQIPENGKFTIGLSAYGIPTNTPAINRLTLTLKKKLRTQGFSIRVVPSKNVTLNSAQILHNGLVKNGAELVLVAGGDKTYIGRTISVQDIDSYAQRDFERPKRDARVGMLPPKLAQIMINLAKPQPGATILDPFCGTGVVLMEAALQGFDIEGSDLEQRMIDYTAANLAWLSQNYQHRQISTDLREGDATNMQWHSPIKTVVAETYLGRPLTALPDRQTLGGIISDCNTIIRKFLVNLRPQLAPDARCCIAVPAWLQPRGGFIHLPVVDELHQIGYNRIRFSCATDDELIYYRPDQTVARELLVLTLK